MAAGHGWERWHVGREVVCYKEEQPQYVEVFKTSQEREGSMVAHKDPTFVDGSEQSVAKNSRTGGGGQRVRCTRRPVDQASE